MKSISLKYFLRNQLESPCPRFNEYELEEKLDEFDEYEDGFIVLSDIGKGGKLYGYEQKPKYIRTVDRNGKII